MMPEILAQRENYHIEAPWHVSRVIRVREIHIWKWCYVYTSYIF